MSLTIWEKIYYSHLKKKKKNLRKIWPREMNISYLSMKDFHTERLETGKKSEVRGDKMVSMSSSP